MKTKLEWESVAVSDLDQSLASELEKEPLPKYLKGDCVRLKQILINLTHNALKFTSYGQVKLFVSYDSASEKLITRVVDTGKGIEKNELR